MFFILKLVTALHKNFFVQSGQVANLQPDLLAKSHHAGAERRRSG